MSALLQLLCLALFCRGILCIECSVNSSNDPCTITINVSSPSCNCLQWSCIKSDSGLVTCSCNNDVCAGKIAASVLVTPLLLVLLVGGIVATIVLIKKKQQTNNLFSTLGNRFQKSWAVRFTRNQTTDTTNFDNPTYNESSRNNNARPSSETTRHKPPVYDEVLVLEESNAVITEMDEEMNYDVIREEFDEEKGFNQHYDNVFEETPYDSVFDETAPYDTVSLGELEQPVKMESKSPLAAYAVASVDMRNPRAPNNQDKFKESFVMNRVKSLQGSRAGARRIRYGKKPIPKPKPKPNASKTKQPQPTEPRLVKSASLSQVENYSHINPKSKYAELEPHIPSRQQEGAMKAGSIGQKPSSRQMSQSSRPKEEYSHLKR